MNLEIIRTQTTWNDAAGSINSNYAKIADAIAQLKANGGADIDLTDYATKVWVEAKGYITASALTPYLKTEDAKGTYATKDFVNNKLVDYAPLTSVQGFENRIGGLESAVPQLNERVTTVEGKVSSLNEIVSTGENNLLDRVNVIEEEYATKTYVDNAIDGIDLSQYLLKADLTKSRIQSTLGISDWALAVTKPSYTASEVGATPSLDDVGANSVKGNGLGYTYATSAHGGHTPGGFISFGSTSYGCQLNGGISGNELAFRGLNNGTFTSWKTLAFASDIPTKLSQLTDDVVAGKYLPLSGGTISGGITINDGYGTSSFSKNLRFEGTSGFSRDVVNIKVDDVSKFGIGGYGIYKQGANDNDLTYAYIGCNGYDGLNLRINKSSIKWGDNDIIHSGNIGNYNAGSATKLQTRHKLWGNDFDGTEDVSGLMYVGNEFHIEHPTTGRQLGISPYWTILGYNNPFIGNPTYVDGRNVYIRYGNDEYASVFASSGNVGIGNTSPTERLDVSGNIKADGNINATSVTIGGVTLSWDSVNNALVVNGNMYGTGSITAKKSA